MSETGAAAQAKQPSFERDLLQRLAFESLREQRRARRWGIFFKFLLALYLLALLLIFRIDSVTPTVGAHTALVDLSGVIAANGDTDADRIVKGLRDAFEADDAKGVILRINSPGGSPVQAGYVNDEIRRLREQYPDKPLYAVVADLCASGGYYAAAAADRIYANKASIVGSIGVRMDSFGFVEAMQKLGVERRLITAGKYKAMLDPFSPEDPVTVGHAKEILEQVHEQFIAVVKAGRGDRLVDNEDIFSGLFWTGEEAKKLGLIDEFGSAGYVAREVVGEKEIVDYTPADGLLDRLTQQLGVAIGRGVGLQSSSDWWTLR